MKYLLPVLLLASLGMAQIFGPAGVPLDWRNLNIEWMESSKLTSPSATSYLSMAGDTLFFTLTGASADRDIVWCSVEEDGTKHCWYWNDGGARWDFGDKINVSGDITTLSGRLIVNAGSSRYMYMDANAASGRLYTASTIPTIISDPNEDGAGTLQLGETGDNDKTYMNSQLYYVQGTIADGDATPSVAGGNVFTTSANTAATEITDLDDCTAGQIVYLVGGSDTNSSTITDGGNFALSSNWTAAEDATLVLLVQADNDYLELSRSAN